MTQPAKITVSLIFTTRDDPWLFQSLAELRALRPHGVDVEVVLVLHGSDAEFATRAEQLAATLGLPVVVGYLPGGSTISAARNCGAALASHETFVFLDSDCVLDPDALRALAGKPIRLANGAIDFAPSGWWFSRHNSALRQIGYRELAGAMPYMPNLVISRELFTEVGGFRTGLSCGEDFEFGDRLLRHGERPRFLADLRVTHLDDRRPRKTFKNWFRNGWGAGARRLLAPGPSAVNLAKLVTPKQRLRHGFGYAVVSTLGALFLSSGYLVCLVTSRGRVRPQWCEEGPLPKTTWVRRHHGHPDLARSGS